MNLKKEFILKNGTKRKRRKKREGSEDDNFSIKNMSLWNGWEATGRVSVGGSTSRETNWVSDVLKEKNEKEKNAVKGHVVWVRGWVEREIKKTEIKNGKICFQAAKWNCQICKQDFHIEDGNCQKNFPKVVLSIQWHSLMTSL